MNKLEYPFVYKNYKVRLNENWCLVTDNSSGRGFFDVIYSELIGQGQKGFWYNTTIDLFKLYIL